LLLDNLDLKLPFEKQIKKIESFCRKLSIMAGYLSFSELSEFNFSILRRLFRTFMGFKEEKSEDLDNSLNWIFKYPIILFLYSVGITSCEQENYKNVADIANFQFINFAGEKKTLLLHFHPHIVFNTDGTANGSSEFFLKNQIRDFPLSRYLRDVLWTFFQDHFVSRFYFDQVFNLFEYLTNLIYFIQSKKLFKSKSNPPLGCFAEEMLTEPRKVTLIHDFLISINERNKSSDLENTFLYNNGEEEFLKDIDQFNSYFKLE